MQRKEPTHRPITKRADKLPRYKETLARLRQRLKELDGKPLHPVAVEAIHHCLTLIELCWIEPTYENDEEITDRMDRMADTVRARAWEIRDAAEAHLDELVNQANSPENLAAYKAWWDARR